MDCLKRFLAALLTLLLLQPVLLSAQDYSKNPASIDYSKGAKAWPAFWNSYKAPEVPEIDLANSSRLEVLIDDGKLYLSLSDALALAIENNLDIAWARYGPDVASTDVLRAEAGAQLRGVQTQINTLSTGLSQTGGGGRGAAATGITTRAGAGGGGGGGDSGDATSFFGTQAVNLDPTLFAGIDFGHFSNPQTSDFVTATNTFITSVSNSNIGISQGFITGTQASLVWANRDQDTNSLRNNFNPSLRSNLTLRVRQPLLRGFGIAVNKRNISVAKNSRTISDLAFKQQVIEIVVRVQALYWDLVSMAANVESQQESLALAQKLYEDNKRRVEIGTLAPIEIVRAEAEVAARQEELTNAETQLKMQETTLKNALSTNGLASPSMMHVSLIPTDSIEVPEASQQPSIESLMWAALAARPAIEQDRIRLRNRDLNLVAIRNGMLPRLDVSMDLTNNGLAGQPNANFIPSPGSQPPSPFFIGGLGTALGQIFRRNFPDYQVRFDLTVPLRNRQAQADMTASLLERRQAEIRMRQSENAIRAEVQNAVIRLDQALARYNSAVKARDLAALTLEAEQKKFDLGASTIFLVVQAQRDLALATTNELLARNNHVLATVDLDRAVGRTLESNDISIAEAYEGVVQKAPSAIPTAAPTSAP